MYNTLVDLFAGCGGLTEGFKIAGFKARLAVEKDPWAAATYAANHHETRLIQGDIQKVRWGAHLPSPAKNRIAGIIGGPPCQGFSLSGNRDPHDPRNSLFMEFVRALKHARPKFFVIENVRGLLSMTTARGRPVIDLIQENCAAAGFKVNHFVLDAADYGVPQHRQRLIIIGLREDLPYCKARLIPKPTVKPGGYVTVDMATSDLPAIQAGEGTEHQLYRSADRNDFQRWMRKGADGVCNHIAMRHTPRLIARFEAIRPGQCVADVPPEHSARQRGNPTAISGKVFRQNNRRLHGDAPAPTVPASFQSNFIHPHLNRNLTAREAARLQSFPDRYTFKGDRVAMSWEKRLSQYKQIGNAVPPLLAAAIARSISRYFDRIKTISDDGDYCHR